MRVKSVTERYRAVNEGTMSKKEFVRQMRQQYPMHITQFNGYDDSVQILRNRGLLFETKKEVVEAHVYDERPALTYSLDALDRGIRIELQTLGVLPGQELIKAADLKKATDKAKKNLEKSATHYLDLMSGESKKVDKHDKMKETKRGAKDADTFNAMKKATLKEGYTEEQIEAAIQRIKERKISEEEEVENIDVVKEAGKTALIQTMNNAIAAIKGKYGEMPGIAGIIRDFLKTHIDDLADGADPLDEFENFVSVNYDTLDEAETVVEGKHRKTRGGKMVQEADYDTGGYVESMGPRFDRACDMLSKAFGEWADGPMTDPGMLSPAKNEVVRYIDTKLENEFLMEAVEEKKGKDHDGDGDIDSDDYMAAKDKAIKGAMSEEAQIKEAVKTLIRKALTEESINEAATGNLSKFSDDYADFAGMTQIINQLENLVTEVEGFYAKTSEKLQKIFDGIGNVTNEEGLKVGGFIAPAIESAFKRDIQPVVKRGFMNSVQIPTIRQISQADIDAHNSGERPLGEEEMEEKQTMFTPVMESKKNK